MEEVRWGSGHRDPCWSLTLEGRGTDNPSQKRSEFPQRLVEGLEGLGRGTYGSFLTFLTSPTSTKNEYSAWRHSSAGQGASPALPEQTGHGTHS